MGINLRITQVSILGIRSFVGKVNSRPQYETLMEEKPAGSYLGL